MPHLTTPPQPVTKQSLHLSLQIHQISGDRGGIDTESEAKKAQQRVLALPSWRRRRFHRGEAVNHFNEGTQLHLQGLQLQTKRKKQNVQSNCSWGAEAQEKGEKSTF